MTATEATVDVVRRLASDIWTWRAEQQPALGDDIPRLPRPPGWLPDFSPAGVARARRRRDELLERWRGLDPTGWAVTDQVDHRLLGSVLARVTWELDVLESWRRDPLFHVHQALNPYFDLLLPRPPFDDRRASDIVAALANVPHAVEQATASLDRPAAPLTAAALEQLDGLGDRLAESVMALTDELPGAHHGPLLEGVAPARAALDQLGSFLAGRHGLPDAVSVGKEAFVWFLRNVALMDESPDELVRGARQEWDRAVVWEAVAKHRAASVPVPPIPASAGEQVAAEAAAEEQVRAFYDDGGFLSQPASLRHYLTAEIPAYLAPLRFLGVCDDLTDEHRLDQDGVSYTLPPGPELPYFYAANARDTRAGIAHEGAHYQQLAMANAHDDPVRRRYYDSGPNEGIAFYNEEYLLQAGLFDDAPHTRAVIWNFARLRALRVEADVSLAVGTMNLDQAVDFFVRRVPMDHSTAFEESCFYAGNPGLALSYQTGKLQLISLVAAAVEAEGADFSLRRTHDALWRNGNVPFALLRWELLDDRSVLDAIDADPATGAPAPPQRSGGRMMRVGAKLPNSGALPAQLGIPHMAATLEAAGFASLWVSDHVVMPETVTSRYPYAADGAATWATDDPWYDSIVALSMAAAVTSSVELGTAVLVLPQRQPVILAKEVASLDRLSGGRVVLGVGAGWLAEEFAALATPFESRGRRADEWIALLRACWTGRPAAFAGEHYQLPAGVVCEPTPLRPVPILVGGTTPAALRRARNHGDGWLGIQSFDALDQSLVASAVVRAGTGRNVLRIVGSAGHGERVAAALAGLAVAGITDVVVDVDWTADVAAQAARLLEAAAN